MYLQRMSPKRVKNKFRVVALDETSHDFYSQINKPSNYSTQLWSIFILKMILFVILYAPIGAIFVYWVCKRISAELMDAATCRAINVSRMEKQFVVNHAICPTEIPALLDSWVTNTLSVKMVCPQENSSPYIFVKHNMFNCWTIKNVSSFVLSHKMCIFVSWAICFPPYYIYIHGSTAPSGPGPPHCRGFMIKLRLNTLDRTHLEGWSARRRDLYLTAHTHTHTHTHRTDIHNPSEIRTHNPSKRATTNPRLRPSGQYDRHRVIY